MYIEDKGKGYLVVWKQCKVMDENVLNLIQSILKIVVLEENKIVKDNVSISYYSSKPFNSLSPFFSGILLYIIM